jgi:hypothetical protein
LGPHAWPWPLWLLLCPQQPQRKQDEGLCPHSGRPVCQGGRCHLRETRPGCVLSPQDPCPREPSVWTPWSWARPCRSAEQRWAPRPGRGQPGWRDQADTGPGVSSLPRPGTEQSSRPSDVLGQDSSAWLPSWAWWTGTGTSRRARRGSRDTRLAASSGQEGKRPRARPYAAGAVKVQGHPVHALPRTPLQRHCPESHAAGDKDSPPRPRSPPHHGLTQNKTKRQENFQKQRTVRSESCLSASARPPGSTREVWWPCPSPSPWAPTVGRTCPELPAVPAPLGASVTDQGHCPPVPPTHRHCPADVSSPLLQR